MYSIFADYIPLLQFNKLCHTLTVRSIFKLLSCFSRLYFFSGTIKTAKHKNSCII